jgi:dTDP-4-amino-4,6-dideoxygalactose transaminase
VRYCGGEVVFADIDPDTYLLDIDQVRALLEASPKGTYSGIIPVDFAGRPVNLEAFRHLSDEYGLWIIEDACHAPGGYFTDSKGNKQMCGNGNYADLAIFSFHPVKHIACGEGGMITTNDEVLYKRLLKLRTHGIVKEDALYTNSVEFAVGSEQKTVNSEQSTVSSEQETVNSEQGTVSSDPFTAHRSPITDNRSPFTANRSPLTDYPGWYMEMQDLGYN